LKNKRKRIRNQNPKRKHLGSDLTQDLNIPDQTRRKLNKKDQTRFLTILLTDGDRKKVVQRVDLGMKLSIKGTRL
jgi:hypothetical protein